VSPNGLSSPVATPVPCSSPSTIPGDGHGPLSRKWQPHSGSDSEKECPILQSLVSVFQGGSVRVHQVPAPLDATHDTEEDANAYAVAMA